MDCKKLALQHSEIWFTHDKKQYDLLQQNTKKLLLLLGYPEYLAKKASEKIKDSYVFYDKAVQSQNKVQKAEFFKKVTTSHCLIMRMLNFHEGSGKNYANWWVEFSKKNYLKVFFLLLKYHSTLIKGWKKIFAPLLTILLTFAGVLGHNRKDKKMTELFLYLYWIIAMTYLKDEIILY